MTMASTSTPPRPDPRRRPGAGRVGRRRRPCPGVAASAALLLLFAGAGRAPGARAQAAAAPPPAPDPPVADLDPALTECKALAGNWTGAAGAQQPQLVVEVTETRARGRLGSGAEYPPDLLCRFTVAPQLPPAEAWPVPPGTPGAGWVVLGRFTTFDLHAPLAPPEATGWPPDFVGVYDADLALIHNYTQTASKVETGLAADGEVSGFSAQWDVASAVALDGAAPELKVLFHSRQAPAFVASPGQGFVLDYELGMILQSREAVEALGARARVNGGKVESRFPLAIGLEFPAKKGAHYRERSPEGLTAVTDLGPLSDVLVVDAPVFAVSRNAGLASLRGLEGLRSVVGSLIVEGNAGNFSSLQGLNNLTTVSNNLRVALNHGLADLAGLDSLEAVGGSASVWYNFELEALNGLERLGAVAGSVDVDNNQRLRSFDGLNALETVGGTLLVRRNGIEAWEEDAATVDGPFNGLAALRSVTGDLLLIENYVFGGSWGAAFQNLRAVGRWLLMIANPTLNQIVMDRLETVGQLLGVQGHSLLRELRMDSLVAIERGPQTPQDRAGFSLQGNGRVETVSFRGLRSLHSIDVTQEKALREFVAPVLEDVADSATFAGAGFATFPPFESLRAVGGALKIFLAEGLTSIDGFNALRTVGELALDTNTALQTVSGFRNLTLADGASLSLHDMPRLGQLGPLEAAASGARTLAAVEVWRMHGLSSLPAFSSLEEVTGGLELKFNDELRDLGGLETLRRVGGDVSIYGNRGIASLAGLGALANVTGTLEVSGNPELLSLTGMDGLERVGGLAVERNGKLGNVTALSSLRTIFAATRERQSLGSGALVASPGVVIRGNVQLGGAIPSWLNAGTLVSPQVLDLESNNFEGRVPEQLCTIPGMEEIAVSGNSAMCGVLPQATCARVVTSEGTGIGGACGDVLPPACLGNCSVDAPAVTSDDRAIPFSFPQYAGSSDLPMKYYWAVGSGRAAERAGLDLDASALFAEDSPEEALRRLRPELADIMPFRQIPTEAVPPDGAPVAFQLDLSNNSLSLANGATYFIAVQAVNSDFLASEPLVSPGSLVDTTAPQAASGTCEVGWASIGVGDEEGVGTLGIEWEAFDEPESAIDRYEYRVEVRAGGGEESVEGALEVGGADVTDLLQGVRFLDGATYDVFLTAVNTAGLASQAIFCTVATPATGFFTTWWSWLVVFGLLLSLIVIPGAALWVVSARRMRRRMERRERDERHLRELVDLTLSPLTKKTALLELDVAHHEELDSVCFVFTDIQDSSRLSNIDREAYAKIQIQHDIVMRKALGRHGGFEIATEGDAFQCAFMPVSSALQFCFDVQEDLLNHAWSQDVYKLGPSTEKRYNASGHLLWGGPRVRMGIHLCGKKEFQARQNGITHRLEFKGSGFRIAKEIGDIGDGGQIILSEAAKNELFHDLSRSGFPIIEELGEFMLETYEDPMVLYHAVPSSLRDTGDSAIRQREFAPLRNVVQISEPQGRTRINPPSAGMTLVVHSLTDLRGGSLSALPMDAFSQFLSVQSTLATQFQAYPVAEGMPVGKAAGTTVGVYAFTEEANAVRFALATQLLVLRSEWPKGAIERALRVPELAVQRDREGRIMFQGLRLACIIHRLNDVAPVTLPVEEGRGQVAREVLAHMLAIDPALAQQTARSAEVVDALKPHVQGGQIVLTQPIWSGIQGEIRSLGQIHVCDLGWLKGPAAEGWTAGMRLWEILPKGLEGRSRDPHGFESLKARTPPGWTVLDSAKDAPNAARGIAAVFTYQGEIGEGMAGTVTEHDFAEVVRATLELYGGYECKSLYAWSFLLVFSDAVEACRWSAAMMDYLAAKGVPNAIRVGCSWGVPTFAAPANTTGRLDYFGPVMNIASRAAGAANEGQIIFAGSAPVIDEALGGQGVDVESLVAEGPYRTVLQAGPTHAQDRARGRFSKAVELLESEKLQRPDAPGGDDAGLGPRGPAPQPDRSIKVLFLGTFELKNIKMPSGQPEPQLLLQIGSLGMSDDYLKNFNAPNAKYLDRAFYNRQDSFSSRDRGSVPYSPAGSVASSRSGGSFASFFSSIAPGQHQHGEAVSTAALASGGLSLSLGGGTAASLSEASRRGPAGSASTSFDDAAPVPPRHWEPVRSAGTSRDLEDVSPSSSSRPLVGSGTVLSHRGEKV